MKNINLWRRVCVEKQCWARLTRKNSESVVSFCLVVLYVFFVAFGFCWGILAKLNGPNCQFTSWLNKTKEKVFFLFGYVRSIYSMSCQRKRSFQLNLWIIEIVWLADHSNSVWIQIVFYSLANPADKFSNKSVSNMINRPLKGFIVRKASGDWKRRAYTNEHATKTELCDFSRIKLLFSLPYVYVVQ